MINMNTPYFHLNNGNKMPQLGLGVYKVADDDEVEQAIEYAIDVGYRMIDTASVYKNEAGVGRAIKSCTVPREELFITTKIWNNAQSMGDIDGAFERSLERLQLDYIDLYLIHWPVPGCFPETWTQLEKIYADGRAKSVGVSNFNIPHLEELAKVSDLIPAVNQFELHPYLYQPELIAYCQANGITVQAHCPLARGTYLTNPAIQAIAHTYGKSPAQIGLRWALDRKVSVIPKSVTPSRILENSQVFDFTLTEAELAQIDLENRSMRLASDPDNFSFDI